MCFLLDLSVVSRFWCVLEYVLATRLIASQKRMEVVDRPLAWLEPWAGPSRIAWSTWTARRGQGDIGFRYGFFFSTVAGGSSVKRCHSFSTHTEHPEPEVELQRMSNLNPEQCSDRNVNLHKIEMTENTQRGCTWNSFRTLHWQGEQIHLKLMNTEHRTAFRTEK